MTIIKSSLLHKALLQSANLHIQGDHLNIAFHKERPQTQKNCRFSKFSAVWAKSRIWD